MAINMAQIKGAMAQKDAVTSVQQSKADLESPAFTGTPTAPTAVSGTNNTQIATTAFVKSEITAATSNFATLSDGHLLLPNGIEIW